jgi:hypothetical protein
MGRVNQQVFCYQLLKQVFNRRNTGRISVEKTHLKTAHPLGYRLPWESNGCIEIGARFAPATPVSRQILAAIRPGQMADKACFPSPPKGNRMWSPALSLSWKYFEGPVGRRVQLWRPRYVTRPSGLKFSARRNKMRPGRVVRSVRHFAGSRRLYQSVAWVRFSDAFAAMFGEMSPNVS